MPPGKSDEISFGTITKIILEESQRFSKQKKSFQKTIWRSSTAIIRDSKLGKALDTVLSKVTCDDQFLTSLKRIETRRKTVHSLFFLGLSKPETQATDRSNSKKSNISDEADVEHEYRNFSNEIQSLSREKRARLAAKLLGKSSLDDEIIYTHLWKRDYRRYQEFLPEYQMSFREIREYMEEAYFEEEAEEEGEGKDLKAKAKAKEGQRARPVLDKLKKKYGGFEWDHFESQMDLKVEVVGQIRRPGEAKDHLQNVEKNQTGKDKKATPASSKKQKSKQGEAPVHKPRKRTSNLSWNYLRLSNNTPENSLNPFIKSEFWSKLHCLYDFNPITSPLMQNRLLPMPSSPDFLNCQARIQQHSSTLDNGLSPWGAGFTGLPTVEPALNEFVLWSSTCLQAMIDNGVLQSDAQGKHLLERIYPQANGCPVISSTGEYWVRLNFLGRQVRVQVDDQVPVDALTQKMLLPLTEHGEIWPLLLVKAVCKLYGIGHFYTPKSGKDFMKSRILDPGFLQSAQRTRESLNFSNAESMKHDRGIVSQSRIHEPIKELTEEEESEMGDSVSKNSDAIALEEGTNPQSRASQSEQNKNSFKYKKNSDSMFTESELGQGSATRLDDSTNHSDAVFQSKFSNVESRGSDFHSELESLISNHEVVYALSGYLPLVINGKSLDSTMMNKFIESTGQSQKFSDGVKVFGITGARKVMFLIVYQLRF